MAKTKKQLIQEREATFREYDYENTCWTCKYGWFYGIGGYSVIGQCQAIEVRGRIQTKHITPADSCCLHVAREVSRG